MSMQAEAGTDAAHYAARITAPDGSLTLVTVSDTSIAVHAGFTMSSVLAKLAEESRLAGSRGREVAHEAPCSVLIARPTAERERWPRSIVVGTGGSPAATAATAVAYALAKRFGVHVRTLIATGGKPLDRQELRSVENPEFDERKPADCLVVASKDADLLVLGGRGRHGFAALGSVSERVMHRASCPILVVR